jgi:ribosomal protein L37AE/L43A
MSNDSHTRECIVCGAEVAHERWALGYKTCLSCGEIAAKKVVRTVAPMHKSNYMMITDLADLRGLNNKGGLVK